MCYSCITLFFFSCICLHTDCTFVTGVLTCALPICYYVGCEYVDVAEQLAIDRVKELFGADYANVQPHSVSQANQAVYFALLQPGDTILGMSLAHGGHLTHGAKPNLSGKVLNAVQYGVNDEGLIDYDEVERLARSEEHTSELQSLMRISY